MLDHRHQEEQDYLVMDFNNLGELFGKGKRQGKILVVFGLTVHHLQNLRLRKWLHMEECSFQEEKALTGELAYSQGEAIRGV